MVETSDIHTLLQTGQWKTSRSKSPKPDTSFDVPVRANQSSKLDPKVPRSFHLGIHGKRFPPPPSVEDEAESLAKEHGSVVSASSDEEPKFRGDLEQHPILLPVPEHNPERRFVLVSGSDDGNDDNNEPKDEYEANTCRKYVLLNPDEERSKGRPELARRKSRQDLPRIETDLRKHKPSVQVNQPPPESDDYFNRRDERRTSDEALLSPRSPVSSFKHTSVGRDRRERRYWDLNNGSNDRYGKSPGRDEARVFAPEERRSAHPSRSPSFHKHSSSVSETSKYDRRASDRPRPYREGSKRGSTSPKMDRKNSSPPYPQSARDSRESVAFPSRTPSHRGKRSSPPREEDEYSSDEYSRGPRPERPHPRRPTVTQEDRPSLLVPNDRASANNKPRSRITTPLASPRVLQDNQFPDDFEPGTSPRSATFPTERTSKMSVADRPVSPFSPTDTSLPRSKPKVDEVVTRPRARSRATSINSSSNHSLPVVMPMPIPIPEGNTPIERRRSPIPPPSHSRQNSYEASPPNAYWQPPPFNPSESNVHLDKPVQTYRRYSEDIKQGVLPQLPECRRKTPIAGCNDWLTIPRADNFDICPACFESAFANTQFRNLFIPAPMRPADQRVSCDFGSSPWYRIAFLMTLKYGYSDLRLLQGIASVANRHQPCAGPRSASRIWYSMIDPYAKRPIGSFTVCHGCARTVEVLLPNLAGVFVPFDSASEPLRGVCAMHFLPERKRFVEYFDLMETTSDRALSRKSAPNIQSLADKIREVSLTTECMRDAPAVDRKWHVMDSLPEFTVCDECFDEVVWPLLESQDGGSHIARKFFHRAQRKPLASCQLYSDRMRDIFKKASRRNDLDYLEDKVKERLDIEADIKTQLTKLNGSDPTDHRVHDEIAQLLREWKEWE